MSFWSDTVGSIANSAGSLLGGGISALGSLFGQSSANRANAEAAANQAAFNLKAYKNRHQWEVADLKKAGLNPILSAGGNPGGVAPYNIIPMQNVAGGAADAFGKVASTAADVMLKEQQTAKTVQEVLNVKMDTWLKEQQGMLSGEQRGVAIHQMDKIVSEYRLLDAQKQGVDLDNKLKQIEVDFYSNAEWARILRSMGITPGPFLNALGKFIRGGR